MKYKLSQSEIKLIGIIKRRWPAFIALVLAAASYFFFMTLGKDTIRYHTDSWYSYLLGIFTGLMIMASLFSLLIKDSKGSVTKNRNGDTPHPAKTREGRC